MAKYSNTHDPYIDPGSQVLRNRLGITSTAVLERVEAALVAVRTYELDHNPVNGRFDLEHLQQIHKRLFGDIYSWAGELRTVDISKGDTRFANHRQIAMYAPHITKALAAERHLKGLSPEAFSERAGHFLGELNVLHPFREGNGRTLRVFISQVARGAGYQIQWDNISREANIAASINAYRGDSSSLATLIRDNLIDYDREAAIELARKAFKGQASFEPPQPGSKYRGLILGQTERYVVQQRSDAADHMILHQRNRLTSLAAPAIGKMVEIDYSSGDVGLLREEDVPAHQHDIRKDRGWER